MALTVLAAFVPERLTVVLYGGPPKSMASRSRDVEMSGRIDPRLAKMEVKASQKRPESVPLPRGERPGGAQALRPDTACGTPAGGAVAALAGVPDDLPSSSGLGFQPYRPIVTVRAKHHDPGAYGAMNYPPAASSSALADSLAGLDNGSGAPADWESRDEMRQRELDEMRARVAQMEKTMRWWSDCTANWREKWSKVRGERNKARDECRQLRARLDEVMKECALHKREKLELVAAASKGSSAAAAAATAAEQGPSLAMAGDLGGGIPPDRPEQSSVGVSCSGGVVQTGADGSVAAAQQVGSASSSGGGSCRWCGDSTWTADAATPAGQPANSTALADALRQLQQERDEKTALVAQVEQLGRERDDVREQLSMCKASATAVRPVPGMDAELVSQPNVKESEDDSVASFKAMSVAAEKQLAELRAQLEVLQADNASEWARRERTDSERYALERDNKKLKAQLDDLRHELDRHTATVHGVKEGEVKAVQKELGERNKELVELRHSHGKLKRLLQERSLELEHSKRRADQYEAEVRKLRTRVDELKRELAETQDELDSLGNANKKLQRTVDELQESNESLGIQLEHAQSRLKSTAADALDYFKNRTIKGAGMPGDEDSTDAFDSDDEFVT